MTVADVFLPNLQRLGAIEKQEDRLSNMKRRRVICRYLPNGVEDGEEAALESGLEHIPNLKLIIN